MHTVCRIKDHTLGTDYAFSLESTFFGHRAIITKNGQVSDLYWRGKPRLTKSSALGDLVCMAAETGQTIRARETQSS